MDPTLMTWSINASNSYLALNNSKSEYAMLSLWNQVIDKFILLNKNYSGRRDSKTGYYLKL